MNVGEGRFTDIEKKCLILFGIQGYKKYDWVSCVVKFIHNHKFITLCKTNIVIIILMFTWTEGNGNGMEKNSNVKRSIKAWIYEVNLYA